MNIRRRLVALTAAALLCGSTLAACAPAEEGEGEGEEQEQEQE